MARLLFKPFSILAGVVAGRIAAQVFTALWTNLDRDGDGRIPDATERNGPVAKAVAAKAIQAATHAGTRAVVDREAVKLFHHLTGLWAGAKPRQRERG